ncbi:GNAT family N-acetyltransferase [Paenibacillus sp. SZ31]|uniref:GNAT family N-acetyltransferase n=1 Tax=unclassified Paenibacillus TaxID=185978 RepID=UPI00146BCE25|nr:GNAT family N-acetyltransferase [Paenibacillus sp. SZ31]NMI02366.1 GNAT family N-acetyltransferase [Paenibacillus sp. SZ31]
MTKFYVREAVQTDAQALVDLNYLFNGVRRNVDEVQQELIHTRETIVVAVLEEQVVGFACGQVVKSFCYKESIAEITEMYILESERRNGLALRMITLLENIFKNVGVKSVKILTGQKNMQAINTYEKAGYHREDHLVMDKKLENI